MALQNDTSRIQYNGNNSTTNSYAIPFVFFENSHIKCVVTTSAGVDTELTLGSGFNVTGAGNANGGSLTTTAAVPTSSKVTIFRNVPATQTTSYQEGGDFPAASHERALDKLTMIAQQTKRLADRALKVPETQNNPNDIPNAGTGKKLLGIDNGTLNWEDNRQLPAYPPASGQKLLSAPGNGQQPSWQDAPSIAVGPITPTGATVSRSIAARFADEINVLDYGADPTGVQDSWLAIQRAIFDSGLDPENRIAATIGANETVTKFNRTLLRLYSLQGFGSYTVKIPKGSYKISRPLCVGQGYHITGNQGGNSTRIVMDNATHGQFTAIMDQNSLTMSDETATAPWTIAFTNYNHGCILENFQIDSNYAGNQSGLIAKDYYWYKWYWGDASYATVSGSSGSTELTSTYAFNYWRQGKIKLYPSGQILDIQYAAHNKIYLKQPLSQNVTAQNYAFGIAKHNGILISGGEGSRISNVWCNYLLGSGIHIFGGSPNQIIENTMMNFCDVGYLIENAPAVLIKPSGDCNNVILQCKGFTNTTVIAGKFEDPRPLSGPYLNPNVFAPYPNITSVRSLIEVEGLPSGTPSFLSINGFMMNGFAGASLDVSCVDMYTLDIPPVVKIDGLRTLAFGHKFARRLSLSGVVHQVYARDNLVFNDDERTNYWGSSPYFGFSRENLNGAATPITIAAPATAESQAVASTGITLDLQNATTLHMSGRLPNRCNFSRSGTTATITYRNAANTANAAHGLRVGDAVAFGGYTFTAGTGNLQWNNNISDGYYPPVFLVKTVPTPETLTITVANAGATAGSATFYALQYVEFHTIQRDEHRIQMPNTVGNPDINHRAFSIYDRKKDLVASLLVPATDKGTWWIKDRFAGGGTVANPAFQILHGAGVPMMSAPNGSIFLRTDGAADTTLYIRADNVWNALTTT